jgi:hypothetical protein
VLSAADPRCTRLQDVLIRSFPEGDDQSASHDQQTTKPDRHAGRTAKHDQIDQLPHDEERGDVESDHAAEFDGREIEREAVAKEKQCPGKELCAARQPGGLTDPYAYDRVAERFQRRCGD